MQQVPLNDSCHLELQNYDNGAKYLTLEYVEHSPAHGYSDTETSVNIDRDKALEMIEILNKFISEK